MKEVTDKNFGVIIAFWLPGFLLLWGLSFSNNGIAAWLKTTSDPSVGNFLYAALASLALGLVVSAVRWLIVDNILHAFFFFFSPLAKIDFSKLKEKDTFTAFQGFVENHYRYYQYYSNTLIAVVIGFSAYLALEPEGPSRSVWLSVVGLIITLLLASGDCLWKYHDRASRVTA